MLQSVNAARLLNFFPSAFALQSSFVTRGAASKRHPIGESATGPEAATKFRSRRNFSRAHGSSLKKLQRVLHIEAGVAPQKYDVPGRRERTILKRAETRAKAECPA